MSRCTTAIMLPTAKILILFIALSLAPLQCGLLIRVNAASEISILSSSGFMTSTEYYRVVGEIENVGDRNFGNIILEVKFYKIDSNMICSINSSCTLSSLSPDRKSSFSIYLTNKTQSLMVNSYEVHVISYQETPALEKKLNIISHKYNNDSIYGVIENKGYGSTRFVRVYATFYDENQTVVDVSTSLMFDSMGRATAEIYEVYHPGVDALNRSIFERARYYSLTAESLEYGLEKEIGLTDFVLSENGEADGNYIFYVFAILVGISAAGLLIVFLIAKAREKARRRRLKRTRKLNGRHASLPDLLF